MLARLAVVMLCFAAATAARDAGEVVRAVEARYDGARTLKATFLERYSEGRHLVRVESGTVYFSRPGRMRWEYESPEEKLFLVDGKQVWFYVPADRTATRTKVRESADWQTPFAMLTGKAKLSRFCGGIALLDPQQARGAERPSAAGHQVLRCLPKSDDAPFREVLVEVDAAHRLVRILVREPGDIETEFRFANWQHNPSLPEVMFHFAAPPGVAIVEDSEIVGTIR